MAVCRAAARRWSALRAPFIAGLSSVETTRSMAHLSCSGAVAAQPPWTVDSTRRPAVASPRKRRPVIAGPPVGRAVGRAIGRAVGRAVRLASLDFPEDVLGQQLLEVDRRLHL